ncbi:hypothetical protein CTAYLR_000186 [Chrysophaeum taylorii]|uniref:AB hydrolase-1 domain-containing protein n=1 Tax=Chrysophaeum taylorii TaxID=2483200 RepID=A0AAD7UG54_9STRA|nr:hypothetical protein CTAYLR_000186 [Chrysophaeum taylorii]
MRTIGVLLVALPVGRSFLQATRRFLRRPRATVDQSEAAPVVWTADGEERWVWQCGDESFETHYIKRAPSTAPFKPVVLVHGFGASFYHWRYTVPALVSKGYTVFCLDLVGFGLSQKPVYDYCPATWSEQVAAFIDEVVGAPAVVVGNSLGGYVALQVGADFPGRVRGVCLLNAAGRFRTGDEDSETPQAPLSPMATIADKVNLAVQRVLFMLSFNLIRRKPRIEAILKSVYPVYAENVDADLVESIFYPATQANAEVYRLVITRPGGPGRPIDDLLATLERPLLLAWGIKDPWIRPPAADKIVQIHSTLLETYPLRRVDIDAGHCPHDENPDDTNAAILNWLETDIPWTSLST